MDVSVIIVNYNSASDLRNCLRSISDFTKGNNPEIIVIDNNSTERDIEILPDEFGEVKFHFLDRNNGFSFGCNIGAKYASGEYFVFLNPDIILKENVFQELLEFMKEKPVIGSCAPMLISSHNTYQCSTGFKAGFWYEFLEAFMLIKVYRKLDYFFRIRNRDLEPITVNWVSGAFMVIKKEIFECLNGFDENFFLNYEDIDLCTRINEKGYTNYYLPYIKCFHSGLSSQGKNYEKLVLNRYESRLVFAQKHYGLFLRTIVRVFHILGLVFRILILIFVSNTKENIQRSKGYRKSLSLYLGKEA